MRSLGDLERSIMDILWTDARPLSAQDVREALLDADSGRELAVTTILTVLTRLEKKGMVQRDRDIRPHQFVAVASREDHTVELLRNVLGTVPDRSAVLARLIGEISPQEAEQVRSMLAETN
ncbi:BlaI/MecI/CopY family transcriptional regulator [Micrococcoides hystricis]|uniref:BlaI/MecI/CopY family transcriptional regulator n=1 Tax=Micrococcoides hystricis TaxID=1572761 RepID=A0ABV6P6V5_9MICC